LLEEGERRIRDLPLEDLEDAQAVLAAIHGMLVENNFLCLHRWMLSESLRPVTLKKNERRRIRGVDVEAPLQGLFDSYPYVTTPKWKQHALKNFGEYFYKAGDETLACLYMAIAEVCELPLQVVDVPGHRFVRWCFPDDRTLNWETTRGMSIPDATYAEMLNIAPEAVKSGAYLNGRGREAVLALAYDRRGRVRQRWQRYEAALADFDKASKLYPAFVEVWNAKGMLHFDAFEDKEEAEAAYLHALALDPLNAGSLNNLAWLYVTSEDPAFYRPREALGLAERAVDQERNAAFLDTLAAAYAELGQMDKALELQKEAVEAAQPHEREELRQRFYGYRQGLSYHQQQEQDQ
jgi:tetratricopeptide (TPR) repeat protein